MRTKDHLKEWVLEALTTKSPATVTEVAKHIWDNHEHDLKASGSLLYTWQYDMRWAAQALQDEGRLEKRGPQRTWRLL